jgi:hypothetical protein
MTDDQKLKIRLAIEDLNAAFTRHLDHGEVEELVDLFAVKALYTHGSRRTQGRSEIEALFRRRLAAGPRTSRHLYSGLRIEIESTMLARGASVCLSFAADGVPPLPALPFLVADFNDVYVADAGGRWRFAERHIERIFVAEHNQGPVGQPAAAIPDDS